MTYGVTDDPSTPFQKRYNRIRVNRLFFAARKPYVEPASRHDLGRMNVLCPDCDALHWEGERLSSSSKSKPKFGICCMSGKVKLPACQDPPEPLRTLLTAPDSSSKRFRDLIWEYNRSLSFTSLGVKEDHSVNNGNRQPVFRISGELHHCSGNLESSDGKLARYSQLYVLDGPGALDARLAQNVRLKQATMNSLQNMLHAHHQYVPMFKQAYEILKGYNIANDINVRLRLTPQLDHRRYNLPNSNEVAVILPDNNSTHPRDIILRRRDGPLYRISDLHPAYNPLQYPLLFPRGENGWYPEMKLSETEDEHAVRVNGRQQRRQQRRQRGIEAEEDDDGDLNQTRRLTLSRYAAYRIQQRPNEFSTLLHGGRLFARYCVDVFASVDEARLRYIRENQTLFRAAQLNHLTDATANDPDNMDLNEIGQRIILPSSYIGGPRNMTQCFQDSMALARRYRKVDLFVTVTTNPAWPEIVRELEPGDTAYSRPDLVARVFKLKQKEILNDIYEKGIFGHTVAYVYTIEFQKRGLPHMHLLIFLHEPHKLLTPEAIDSCISAEIPDPETQPLLYETVTKYMLHACSDTYCLKNGKCSKGFPKEFCEETTLDDDGYPKYRRRNNGRTCVIKNVVYDNRHVAPYTPYLSARFHCHINVECAVCFATLKYAFKYVQKGPDMGSLEVVIKDEVQRWVDGRYISAPDAMWRIFHFDTHEQTPNVVRLQIHLPDQQYVYFDADADAQDVLNQAANKFTTLTAFFEANRDQGALGQLARKYTYQEFPQHFVYDKNNRKWKIRKQGFALGRMYFLRPTSGEVFYLRLLLTVVRGVPFFCQPVSNKLTLQCF